MQFDPSTLFVTVVASTIANAVLLGWAWGQNWHERALLWTSIGFLAVGVGNMLLAGRGVLPSIVTVDIANAVILYGTGMVWIVARRFNGRSAPQAVPLAGAAVWLLLVQFAPIGEVYEMRIMLASLVSAAYLMAGAREFWVNDGIRSRFPVAALLAAHSLVVAARIPIAFMEAGTTPSPDFDSPWFTPMALETLVFVQALAILLLTLTKERAEARLKTMALTDPLTGLANRRAFFIDGKRLIAAAKRAGQPTALIAFDLDRFKSINDTFGHPFGDAVLEAFALAAREGLRGGDLAGRIGGEEFAAVLPGADAGAAHGAADRVVSLFADIVGVTADERARFTASAGIAVSLASSESIEALFIAADKALYEAKNAGGNQMRMAAPVLA